MHRKVEKHIVEGTSEYYIMNIFTHIDCFWVLESNGINPQILSNKYIMFGRNEERQ